MDTGQWSLDLGHLTLDLTRAMDSGLYSFYSETVKYSLYFTVIVILLILNRYLGIFEEKNILVSTESWTPDLSGDGSAPYWLHHGAVVK